MHLSRSIALLAATLLASALTGPAAAAGSGHCARRERVRRSSRAPVWTT
ncbi:hypothetical protein [Streptomyces gibsoniae]|uniref:Uncharacterized protein n=1 Tax=Streptomyces gibsoniae TaxID=3075529 RepID=A0ABU2U8T1_9ACTN|nr:hypothetical protein [Streptomyces sp. DSM 41699]MDT0469588.1 hypothetical protein [Streptomyces sp. DSM 41699]